MTQPLDFEQALALNNSSWRLAQDLLGQLLVSTIGGDKVAGRIIETEAYLGVNDPASHAWQGRRNQLHRGIWNPANCWYVYRSYGIHWCLNLTLGGGLAVLIRAIRPVAGLTVIRNRRGAKVAERNLADGPGKVGQALGISGAEDGLRNHPRSRLHLEPRATGAPVTIRVTPRIGISRAVDWPLRFLIQDG